MRDFAASTKLEFSGYQEGMDVSCRLLEWAQLPEEVFAGMTRAEARSERTRLR